MKALGSSVNAASSRSYAGGYGPIGPGAIGPGLGGFPRIGSIDNFREYRLDAGIVAEAFVHQLASL